MKVYAVSVILLLAGAATAQVTRVGPFEGSLREDNEDWNFLSNPARFAEPFQVESGPNAIHGFSDDRIDQALFLRDPWNDPGASGYAYSGKSLSISTTNSRIMLLPYDGTPGVELWTHRFGAWFMLNSQRLTIQFIGFRSDLGYVDLGTDTISGDSQNLQYQWFGWQRTGDVPIRYALLRHEGPRDQYSNFHVDAVTWDPVPEPASLFALAGGLGLLARRRKRYPNPLRRTEEP